MNNTVYRINKGINRSIELKGLKAQYIWWLGGGAVVLLVFFAILYIAGVNSIVCIGIVVVLATFLVFKVYAFSNRYGEFGLMKAMARRRVPKVIKIYRRSVFKNLKDYGKADG